VATRHDSRVRPARERSKSKPVPLPSPPQGKLGRYLNGIAAALEDIYCDAVTGQAALKGQNAEQDLEIARFLRRHISGPVSALASDLRAYTRHRLAADAQSPVRR
jgi:hypothetical protein